MKYAAIICAACAVLLAGCGADTMEAAATAGALKQQELEQGERTRDAARSRIDAATAEMRRRQERTAERVDGY